jgi:hypothetical protein
MGTFLGRRLYAGWANGQPLVRVGDDGHSPRQRPYFKRHLPYQGRLNSDMSLEHVWDVDEAVTATLTLLRAGGRYCAVVPVIEGRIASVKGRGRGKGAGKVGGKVPVSPAARSRPPRRTHAILSTPRRSRSTA